MKTNVLYYGDNLDILRSFAEGRLAVGAAA